MDKWEYKIEATTREHGVDLNKLGEEGWELVTVVSMNKEAGWQDYKYIFKRRKA